MLYMNTNNTIILTALQKAKNHKNSKVIQNIKLKNIIEFKAKLRASCNKCYNKVKDNEEFKQKVSAQKNFISEKVEPLLFDIKLDLKL